ncbi:hypothetical protein SteCoe_35955 [Stentor coeruleus]|uniref:Uncharacterized protein n=1 Tax=Stentor coeruleus TaxID=5963 RepID=A0A1R2AR71_9CILI|nr:hypothetical protein SteCoe_35955 [Stentor coeruleus]
MFSRALKLKFNEQKFVQVSIVRLQRLDTSFVHSAGKKVCLLGGLMFLPSLIKMYRKGPTHKVCYVPLRKGLLKLKDDPYHQVLAKGEVYGDHLGPKGRFHFP